MARLGRPKLVWLVTVRSNNGRGCHVYGLYETKALALQVKERLDREIADMQERFEGFVQSHHWISCFAQPVQRASGINRQQLERFARSYWPTVQEVTP